MCVCVQVSTRSCLQVDILAPSSELLFSASATPWSYVAGSCSAASGAVALDSTARSGESAASLPNGHAVVKILLAPSTMICS